MNIQDIMRQAQEMQGKLAEAQELLGDLQVEGAAGGGMVKVTLKGKGDLAGLTIDPSLVQPGDGEIIEDLVKAAHADARRKLEKAHEDAMKDATSGLGVLPGFKMPF
ncbi:MAG: YbaB/EbfC family nucleoid-associated protein [Hirschia sp.]|nr:YbaB/EbfC family nucleoid-associated protein [Hirschia sp.]MBF17320.1 YbaB/EbfC family nucleoid-associated protein [Hirschia sp.]|tara:strand:+ start:589 stop:909 length:321 start_codon:yes stop_codon:yes gene_type:complete